jgi:hypothetical protein
MRKSILATPSAPAAEPTSEPWLDLDQIAHIEITSEDANHPIETP